MTHTLRFGTGGRVLALDPRLANALLDRTMVGQESVDDPLGRTGYTCPVATLVETLVLVPRGLGW